jgi:hypothetical protein
MRRTNAYSGLTDSCKKKKLFGDTVKLVIFLVPQKTGGTTGTGLKYRLPNQSTNENVLS